MIKNNITRMYIFQFFLGLYFVGGVLIPFFTDWGGISFTQVTILQSWFVVWIFILEIPTGVFADRFGRKHSLIIGCLAFAMGVGFYVSTPHFAMFLLGEFLFALSRALISGSDGAIIYDSLKEQEREFESKKVFGRFRGFHLMGMATAAPIGGLIAHFIGLREVFAFTAIPTVFALLIALGFKEPLKATRLVVLSYTDILTSGIKHLSEHKVIKILAFDQVVIWSLLFMVIWIYQVALKDLGVPIVWFGVIHASILLLQVCCLNSFGHIERILGSKKRYLTASAIVPAISLMLASVIFLHSTLVVIFLIVLSLGIGLPRRSAIESYMHKYIETENRATVISAINALKSSIQAVMYPLIGIMVDKSLWPTIFLLGLVILIVASFSRIKEEHLID